MTRALIIHATDLAAGSDGAFHHALKLALVQRARLRLVHVHERDGAAAPIEAFPHVRQTLAKWGLMAPGAPAEALDAELGLAVSKAEAVASRPEAALEHLVADAAPQLIVLGTRGADGLELLRQASFAETLARHARAPALFVPQGARGFVGAEDGALRLNNVLVPIAHAPDPAPALEAAYRLLDVLASGARIHVLHVGEAAATPPLHLPGPRPHTELARQGPVVETIVSVADEVDADLIVMATAGHQSLLDSLRGSTTERVLRRARRPLLAVPAG
jgi:nucleotide-binding universal stress UspA family protein